MKLTTFPIFVAHFFKNITNVHTKHIFLESIRNEVHLDNSSILLTKRDGIIKATSSSKTRKSQKPVIENIF